MGIGAGGFVLFCSAGFVLGCVSGLTPGLHVNNLAFLLAGIAGTASEFVAPTGFGLVMVTAAVTHTFLDILPSIVLGVPDESMALVALPGHRMVLDGDGREAVVLSASGSMLAVAFSFFVAVPVTLVMVRAYSALSAYMPLVLAGTVLFLVLTERGGEVGTHGHRKPTRRDALAVRAKALVVLGASGLLGYYVLTLGPDAGNALVGEPTLLMPLFVGLFGVPILAVSAFEDADIPEQKPRAVALPRRSVFVNAVGGGFAGSLVGWLPGVSPAVATSFVQSLLPDSEDEPASMRSFIVAVSGVDTSNAVFALLALYYIGLPRSGTMVALTRLDARVGFGDVVAYLVGIAVVSVAAFGVTVALGKYAFGAVRRADYRVLSAAVVAMLVVLTFVFSGIVGLPILVASTVVGLVPNYTRVRRVNCMGALLLPLIVLL
ncbi:MAG: tripartite tricarboxylate transporter permease [Halobacteriales archaeon]|nr:tripartite tricarboxylate transporter permease [Halobacteriales archaeon]